MKTKYFLDKKSFCGRAAFILLLIAVPFFGIGGINYFKDMAANSVPLVTEVALPAVACLLFALFIAVFGRKGFWTSFLPLMLGMIALMLLAFKENGVSLIGLGEVFICFLIVILYSCTIFGAIGTKFFAFAIIVVELAFKCVFQYWPLVSGGTPVGAVRALGEVAWFFMILGFAFVTLGLRKKNTLDKEKAKAVTPPLPGNGLAHSDPNPAEVIPAPVVPEIPQPGEKPAEEAVIPAAESEATE